MIYNLADEGKLEAAHDMLYEFALHGKTIELKVYKEKRSNPQNRALHLLLGYMSNETGYTLEECKELYKEINKTIYKYFKPTINGEDVREFTRSSASLSTEEMAKSIDTLYKVCSENGIELPLLQNESEMISLQNEIDKNRFHN